MRIGQSFAVIVEMTICRTAFGLVRKRHVRGCVRVDDVCPFVIESFADTAGLPGTIYIIMCVDMHSYI
jgi:hypothetical protein